MSLSLLRYWLSKMPLPFLKSLLDFSFKNLVCIAVTLFICVYLSVYETYVAFRKTGFCKVQQ